MASDSLAERRPLSKQPACEHNRQNAGSRSAVYQNREVTARGTTNRQGGDVDACGCIAPGTLHTYGQGCPTLSAKKFPDRQRPNAVETRGKRRQHLLPPCESRSRCRCRCQEPEPPPSWLVLPGKLATRFALTNRLWQRAAEKPDHRLLGFGRIHAQNQSPARRLQATWPMEIC